MKVLRLFIALFILGASIYSCELPSDEALNETEELINSDQELEQQSTENDDDEETEPPAGPSGS